MDGSYLALVMSGKLKEAEEEALAHKAPEDDLCPVSGAMNVDLQEICPNLTQQQRQQLQKLGGEFSPVF